MLMLALAVPTCLLGTNPPKTWATVPAAETAAAEVEASVDSLQMSQHCKYRAKYIFSHIHTFWSFLGRFRPLQYAVSTSLRLVKLHN